MGGSSQPTDWSRATSASDGGGLQALINAARREGQLTLPMRRSDSAGWLANLYGFQQTYGIHVNVVSGDNSDAAQVADVRRLDALDLSPDVADANTSFLAPYLVFYWLQIPSTLKQPKAYWYADCGGYMAIGYDAARVAAVTSVAGLTNPDLAGGVAVLGDPTVDEGALTAVVMAALANGGSPDNVAPGVDFFHRLHAAGNLAGPGPAGSPAAVLDWEFAQPGLFPNNPSWSFTVPPEAAVVAYRAQAISRYARHPAAARLWEEYLLSDTGQNVCLTMGARPSRLSAMQAEGTLDVHAAAALTPIAGTSYVLSARQLAAAQAYVAAHWAAAIGR